MPATIAELEALLGRAKLNPKQFFGDDLDSVLRDCLGKSHPDRFQESDKARADEIFKEFQSAAESTKTPDELHECRELLEVFVNSPNEVDDIDVVRRAFAQAEKLMSLNAATA